MEVHRHPQDEEERKTVAFECVPLTTQMVKPSKPPPYPIPSMHSSNLDRVIANIYVNTVYFFEHRGSPNFFCIDKLTRSLSHALSLFYPIAGTITADLDIVCNGAGALFLQAAANCSLSDLGDFTPHPRLLALIPSLDDFDASDSQPLLLIQITRFECGGVAMGIALEHHVADGASALSFMKAWSSLARGETITEPPPSFDKAWLRANCPPAPQFVHDEYLKLPKPGKAADDHAEGVEKEEQQTVVRMFDLSREFMKRLKGGAGATGLTTYEMLTAHVWRCCCKARALGPDVESLLVMAVDGRVRLKTREAEEEKAGGDDDDGTAANLRYVGNVIFNCCVEQSVGNIIGAGSTVSTLGKCVHSALKRMDATYCRSAIDFLETCTRAQLQSFVKGRHTFATPNLGLISWAVFPFYEVDFGWGIARHVGPVDMPWEGHAYLLRGPPSADDRGLLRLCISLQRRHMPAFARLLFQLPFQ